ncbi:MAG: hypothetical protein ACI959_000378 [Limisphaerales bacterium]|jgi:hypothetical protein
MFIFPNIPKNWAFLTLLVWFAGPSVNLFAQSITFERTYGERLAFKEIIPSNSDFIAVGNAIDTLAIETAWIFKVDETGDPVWTNSFSGNGSAKFNGITKAGTDGYLLVGSTSTTTFTGRTGYLVRCNEDGDSLWTRTLAFGANTDLFAIQEMPDGGFAISGRSAAGGGLLDAVLFRLDADGILMWSSSFGTAGLEQFFDICLDDHGGFTMVGSFFNGTIDKFFMINADATGTQVWSTILGHGENDFGYSIFNTPSDGGYLVAGQGTFGGDGQALVIKTDSLGNFIWEKQYGTPAYDRFRDILINDDDEIIVCGSFGKLFGNTQATMLLLDSSGDSIYSRQYGGFDDDEFYSANEDGDGGYIFAGSKGSQGYLVKTGDNGIVCQQPDGLASIPNSYSAELSWNSFPGLLGYRVEYRPFGTVSFSSVVTASASTLLLGLEAETMYQWRISSTCTTSESSPYTSLETFTTGLGDPNGISGTFIPEFSVSPNPINNIIRIEAAGSGEVYLYNSAGIELFKKTVTGDATIDVSFLNSGMYLFQFEEKNTGFIKTIKLVKE